MRHLTQYAASTNNISPSSSNFAFAASSNLNLASNYKKLGPIPQSQNTLHNMDVVVFYHALFQATAYIADFLSRMQLKAA